MFPYFYIVFEHFLLQRALFLSSYVIYFATAKIQLKKQDFENGDIKQFGTTFLVPVCFFKYYITPPYYYIISPHPTVSFLPYVRVWYNFFISSFFDWISAVRNISCKRIYTSYEQILFVELTWWHISCDTVFY